MAERAVIAKIIETRASMPRREGAWLALFESGRIIGTIGGGSIEHLVLERCRRVLAGEEEASVVWYTKELTGMACGGDARVDIHRAGEGEMESLLAGAEADRLRAFVYGAGHVGAELVHLLARLDFDPVVVDDRSGMAVPERLPDAARIVCGSYRDLAALNALPDGRDFAVVLTHGHAADVDVLDQLLPRRPAYVGCIGSRRKAAIARDELVSRGHGRDLVDSIHLPIGEGILAVTPAEIAVSIAAQMIRVRAGMRSVKPHGRAGRGLS